jgi:hypothetical protein
MPISLFKKCKITSWKERLKNRADWEKSIQEVKARFELYCHRRRRRRIPISGRQRRVNSFEEKK